MKLDHYSCASGPRRLVLLVLRPIQLCMLTLLRPLTLVASDLHEAEGTKKLDEVLAKHPSPQLHPRAIWDLLDPSALTSHTTSKPILKRTVFQITSRVIPHFTVSM